MIRRRYLGRQERRLHPLRCWRAQGAGIRITRNKERRQCWKHMQWTRVQMLEHLEGTHTTGAEKVEAMVEPCQALSLAAVCLLDLPELFRSPGSH